MSAEIETLHEPFIKWLKAEGIPYIRARDDRESTIAKGHPDFTLLAQGRVLLIEFKDKETRTSADQEKRTAELEATGCKVHVVRNLTIAIELATAWRSTLGTFFVARKPAEEGTALVRFGAGIFRKLPGGRLEHVRLALPEDSSVPVLVAA